MTPLEPPRPPRRRKRYSGTHPKCFDEKYKEHAPKAYPQFHKHLRAKGKTPAGTHIPVLAEEVIAMLKPKPGETVADCTVGYGGHTIKFAKHLGQAGKLIALDIDAAELKHTKKRLSNIETPISFWRRNFAEIEDVMKEANIGKFDIIFADLGVSSMQVDDASRGISYKNKGPLDMRMDKRLKNTGADLLQSLSADEISDALWELSDEPDHEQIAKRIIYQRAIKPITQTSQLIRLVFSVKGLNQKQWRKQQIAKGFGTLHPAARTFQTLRILVNDEINALKKFLKIAPKCLNPNGRIGIISFHSGEDRLVKKSFKQGKSDRIYVEAARNPLTPRTKEIISNPRSSSAKFRWAKKHG